MTPLRRLLVAAAATAAVLALGAPAALAATITNSGGTLTYSGGSGDSYVTFARPAANTINVERTPAFDNDPITSATGCTENTAGVEYTCAGVTRVVANGNAGSDSLDATGTTEIPFTLDGGDGEDSLYGGAVDDALTGGADGDLLRGGTGGDSLDGAAGDDGLEGGGGNDTLNAGAGADYLLGDDGDDTLDAGEGDDYMAGADGNDLLRGDGGDDDLIGDAGNDGVSGGTGYDTAYGPLLLMSAPPDLAVSLDDAANDRQSGGGGEADNVHVDVEGISTEGPFDSGFASRNDTLTGSSAPNTIRSGAGNDTVDGGANNDVLAAGDGDDTVRARDGWADFVSCGAGTDAAEVDTLDTVEECETVDRADAGNANEDRPPTVQLDGPAAGALLGSAVRTTMSATATDDRGIAQVLFIDDDRIVCADAIAPYTCDYAPRGEDVGRNTLVAVAVDTAQQTASVTRTFSVDRFTATITGRVTPARDTRRPFRFRTTGRLRLPAGVSPLLGCVNGIVSIQVKTGGKTISTRRANVRRDCAFASSVTFASRRRFTRRGTLRFTLRFTGNEVLKRSTAVARNVRTRR